MLTSNLLGSLNQLVPRCIVTIAMQSLVPLWQAQRCNHELSQVLSIGKGNCFIPGGARNGSRFVGYVYGKYKRSEIGFNVRHAIVVEEESVVDLRPFEVGLAKGFDALFSEGIEW